MKTTRSSIRVIALLLLVLALPSFLCAQSRPAADLIIRNAKIWTVDKNRPTAEAVAVLGERIVAVGSSAEIEAWQSVHTRVIDAAGKLLLPGFNDSHVHFVDGGLALDSVELNDATSAEEFARRIGERQRVSRGCQWRDVHCRSAGHRAHAIVDAARSAAEHGRQRGRIPGRDRPRTRYETGDHRGR